jgi:hypothetical protein
MESGALRSGAGSISGKQPCIGQVSLRLTSRHRVPSLKRRDALSIGARFDEHACASETLPPISTVGSSPDHLVT